MVKESWNSAASRDFALPTPGSSKRCADVSHGDIHAPSTGTSWTWYCAEKRDIGLVKWSRTYHSADGDTDHSLILSQVNLPKKKPAPKKSKPRRSLNTAAMRESDSIKAFCATFETKLRGSAPDVGIDPVDPDVCWEKLKAAFHESAVASFGIKRPLREH